jgi:hypothetical protein
VPVGLGPGKGERYFLEKSVRRALADPAGLGRTILSNLFWLTQK